MALTIPESELPLELSIRDSIAAAYPEEIDQCVEAIQQRLPLLITCDKEITQYLYAELRGRIRARGITDVVYIDGRLPEDTGLPAAGLGMATGMGAIIQQLRDAVRDAVNERLLVLPHLDLLTTSSGMLTGEAREVIALLYENPELLFLGFCDASFPLPKVIEQLFPRQVTLLGLRRDRLRYLVTQREARKFSATQEFAAFQMFKYVSGLNAVRLRRLLSSVTGLDYPADSRPAYAQLRQATLTGEMSIPNVDIDNDIGGYDGVRCRLKEEILSLLEKRDEAQTVDDLQRIEKLIPRGMIFWGPPGTGKTLFAKAMATALEATVIIVSGPEMKSKWVGEGEANIRNVFRRARQSAPAVIVFDELDSIAATRSTASDGGSRAEASMVNQLLTEMDGFRADALVFVVGTTNFVEALDPAVLRPGRFEFHLEIPYPDDEARQAIFEIYDRKMALELTPAALDLAVTLTGDVTPDTGTHYSGDHIQAVCRQLARDRIRSGKSGETLPEQVECAIGKRIERPKLSAHERLVVATHEIGHALVSLHCKHAPVIDRISLMSNISGALGEVRYEHLQDRYILTEEHIQDRLCTLFGGLEAERLIFGVISAGNSSDMHRATLEAHGLVTHLGVGTPDGIPVTLGGESAHVVGGTWAARVETAVSKLLTEARNRAQGILAENREELLALRELLLERGTLRREDIRRT